jgi:hypothetical protein
LKRTQIDSDKQRIFIETREWSVSSFFFSCPPLLSSADREKLISRPTVVARRSTDKQQHSATLAAIVTAVSKKITCLQKKKMREVHRHGHSPSAHRTDTAVYRWISSELDGREPIPVNIPVLFATFSSLQLWKWKAARNLFNRPIGTEGIAGEASKGLEEEIDPDYAASHLEFSRRHWPRTRHSYRWNRIDFPARDTTGLILLLWIINSWQIASAAIDPGNTSNNRLFHVGWPEYFFEWGRNVKGGKTLKVTGNWSLGADT